MHEIVIGTLAFAVALLTLFSGFGLGTLLMPAFALFFPLPVAVGATAVVHGLNNLLKLGLLRRDVDWGLVARFGLPATLAAFGGAALLASLARAQAWLNWTVGEQSFRVTPVGAVMGLLILAFAFFELAPARAERRAAPRSLWLGGLLSGFFGGLSGHQGALRAAFLGRLSLPPGRFAATQAAIAVVVDGARTLVYGLTFPMVGIPGSTIAIATACAFAGSLLGAWLLPKVTVGFVRRVTGVLLVVVGLALATGLI